MIVLEKELPWSHKHNRNYPRSSGYLPPIRFQSRSKSDSIIRSIQIIDPPSRLLLS